VRRVLVVAYYFPPIGGIGSIRMSRFAEHLPEFGWEPRVLAPRDTPHAPDPELDFPEHRVLRAYSFEVSRLNRAVPGENGGATGPERADFRDRLRSLGRRLVFPDAQIGWYPGAVAAGLRLLQRGGFDAIYSSSFPFTAHLVGRTLSRRAGLPWIAEFRDPWSDSLPAGSSYRRRGAALEQSTAAAATELIMPTPTWAAHFGQTWQRPIAVIPNGFDAPVTAPRASDPPIITYLGTYFPERQQLAELWRAIARLADDRPLRLRFIGAIPAAGRAELAAAGIDNLIEETGFVSHDESLQLLASSTVLVAGGEVARDVIAKGRIPAKLFEYLATSLPIVYLGDPEGDAARMLRNQPGCQVVERKHSTALLTALASGLAGRSFQRDAESLSRRSGTRLLARVLDAAAAL
jgi:glycosyltransferase involved in cell wall biosynthesis